MVLLPGEAPGYARAVGAVKAGMLAARKVAAAGADALPVLEFADTTDDPAAIEQRYGEVVKSGAALVIGPLTRDAVTQIAVNAIATRRSLMLNQPDGVGSPSANGNLLFFGLALEQEAMQAQRVAAAEIADGMRQNAVALAANGAAYRRAAQAFARASANDPRLAVQVVETEDTARIRAACKDAQIVFVAGDAGFIGTVRPYLPREASVLATSHANPGDDARINRLDLEGVEFVDMPWLLEPDHAAVMSYARPDPEPGPRLSNDLQRLYALGIDAWRVGVAWLDRDAFEIDGVTGRLRVDSRRLTAVGREPVRARMRDGAPVLVR